jgi:hypothetical protein
MLQAPLGVAYTLQPSHRTSSAQFANGTASALNSGIIRENSLAELSNEDSGFTGAGASSAQRATQTPGHSGFAQLPAGNATGSTSGAGPPNPTSSSHDSFNFVAPHPGKRSGHAAHSASMQVINSGQATESYPDSTGHRAHGADDTNGAPTGEAGDVPMEWVPVRLTSKCPQGCGCVCRVVAQMERVPVAI